MLLARRIKRQTFGLEPDEIATLLEQREAVLHGIREGTIATDALGPTPHASAVGVRARATSGIRSLSATIAPSAVRDRRSCSYSGRRSVNSGAGDMFE